MGYHFTPQTNCVITMLGVNANGLVTLKLWNKDSGVLLAETNVTSTNTWRFVKIIPVAITNGGNYSVGGYYGEESITKNRTVSPSFPQTYGAITITSSGFNNEYDGGIPDHNYTTSMYGRVDFIYVNYTNSHAPEITSTPDTYAVLSNSYTYDVDAIDYNGDTLTYSLLTNPAGMTIDSTTGIISWTPTNTNIQSVSVKVTDGKDGEKVQNFVLTVQILQTPWRTIEHGTRTTYHGYRVTGFYFTPQKDGQIFELAGRYTSGERMYIYDTVTRSRLIKSDYVNPGGAWTLVPIVAPVEVLAGRRYAFMVYYRGDRYTGVTNIPWTIGDIRIDEGFTENGTAHCPTVSPDTNIIYGGIDFKYKSYTNSTPYITSSPVLHENILSEKEFSYDCDAIDIDSDVITYSLLDKPTGMTINSTNGQISWIPSTNQEGTTNYVRIKVSDPYGKYMTESFDLVVASGQTPWRRIENGTYSAYRGYRTTGFYFTPQKDGRIIKVGGRYDFGQRIYIYDTVTSKELARTDYHYPSGVWKYVDITPVTVIAGRRYALMVYYNGGRYTGVTNIPWTTGDIRIDGGVSRNGDPTCPTTDPETSTIYGGIDMVFNPYTFVDIYSTPGTYITVSNQYSYDANASDPNGTGLTFSLLINPTGMTINSSTGVVSWTPIFNQIGYNSVTIQATDGTTTGTQSYQLYVSEGQNPVMKNETAGTPDYASVSSYTYGYHFTPLKDGQITELGGNFKGTCKVSLWNRTSGELLASTNVTAASNWSFVSITPVDVYYLENYTVAVTFNSGDIRYRLLNIVAYPYFPTAYDDIRIDYGTYISGDARPTADSYSDDLYGVADICFKPNTNTVPAFNEDVNVYIEHGTNLSYSAGATDPDTDTLTYSLLTNPSGMTINTNTGLLTWTPSGSQTNDHNVSVKVVDGNGGERVRNFIVNVFTITGRTPWKSSENGSTSISTWTSSTPYNYGYHFTALQSGQITMLGGKFKGTCKVSLWNKTTGVLLASTNVTSSSNWVYVPINPVSVSSNDSLTVAVLITKGIVRFARTYGIDFPYESAHIRLDYGTYISSDSRPTANNYNDDVYGMPDICFKSDVNIAPQITTSPEVYGATNVSYSYDVDASDPDADTLSYSLLTNPSGMTINSTNGQIFWTPSASQTNDHNVTVKVEDGKGGEDIQSYVINVGLTLPQSPWKDNENGNLTLNQNWNYTMGYHFTPQSDGEIVRLGGYFDGTKTVKLWDKTTGTLLAETNVTSAYSWSYVSITPVTVYSGSNYTVAVFLNNSGGSYRSSITSLPETYGDITIDYCTYATGDVRPTGNSASTTMYGQVDILFFPSQ